MYFGVYMPFKLKFTPCHPGLCELITLSRWDSEGLFMAKSCRNLIPWDDHDVLKSFLCFVFFLKPATTKNLHLMLKAKTLILQNFSKFLLSMKTVIRQRRALTMDWLMKSPNNRWWFSFLRWLVWIMTTGFARFSTKLKNLPTIELIWLNCALWLSSKVAPSAPFSTNKIPNSSQLRLDHQRFPALEVTH